MSASFAPECNEVKERYDTCFLKWYSEKFLRGTAKEDECEPLFKQYKTCLTKALKDKGIESMIEEARADNKDNDIEYMKPSSGTKCKAFLRYLIFLHIHRSLALLLTFRLSLQNRKGVRIIISA